MYSPPVDYTANEIRELVSFMEQYIKHEPNADYQKELTKALAIIRAVHKIGTGTEWLSKMSDT